MAGWQLAAGLQLADLSVALQYERRQRCVRYLWKHGLSLREPGSQAPDPGEMGRQAKSFCTVRIRLQCRTPMQVA